MFFNTPVQVLILFSVSPKSCKKLLTKRAWHYIISSVPDEVNIKIKRNSVTVSTADSDSACWGSNPYSSATKTVKTITFFAVFYFE